MKKIFLILLFLTSFLLILDGFYYPKKKKQIHNICQLREFNGCTLSEFCEKNMMSSEFSIQTKLSLNQINFIQDSIIDCPFYSFKDCCTINFSDKYMTSIIMINCENITEFILVNHIYDHILGAVILAECSGDGDDAWRKNAKIKDSLIYVYSYHLYAKKYLNDSVVFDTIKSQMERYLIRQDGSIVQYSGR